MTSQTEAWPELPYEAWKDTYATLHLWTQIAGKVRLALTPWLNHSWHVALYVTARGLTTGPMRLGARELQIDFDFIDHVLWLRVSDGSFRQVMRQMEHERGGIDRLVSNRRLYLDVREQLGPVHDPLLRDEIARIETGYSIGRHLVLREVLGQAPAGFSAATKTFCTEFEQRVADFCARAAGADALVWGRVARNVCYAPAYTIMGGTTNILRNILGERLLGLPREPRPAAS